MGKDKPPPPPLLWTCESAKQSIYNLLENRYQTTCIPVLSNKTVIGSAYGWLVVLDRTEGDCCLWNPSCMETIQLLQNLEDPAPYNSCVLSKPPTDPNCFIVFTQSCSAYQTVYRIGDNTAFKVNAEEEGYQVIAMVSCQGVICGLVEPGYQFQYEFATFHMVGDKLEARPFSIDGQLPWEVPQPMPGNIWFTANNHYLIESSGYDLLLVTQILFDVYLDTCDVQFRVFRVNLARMEFEELENLDGQTVFIGWYGNGFCRSSESFGSAIKSNSIYYTNGKGMVVYVYDMDDRSTITLQPYPDSNINPSKSESCWVDLPQTSRSIFPV